MSPSPSEPTAPIALDQATRVVAGRYELRQVLGSGGMAVVWLATDRVLDRDVAVKILREQFAADPVFRERFTREALHAARLSHPGVVTTFDAGVDEGTAYLVMEAVQGRTLHEVLTTNGPLPVGQAVAIAADVCDALAAAHRAGIVHRDIKPGNILISDSGRTRVFDFGIARVDGLATLTQVSTVIGTPAYVSPEQAAGGEAGPQSDLYAVGCVLTEMLTGSPPFAAETPVAVLYRHIHDPAPVPSRTRPEVTSDLDLAVLHLLAKDPALRPSGAAAARAELLAAAPAAQGDTRVLPTATKVLPVAALAPQTIVVEPDHVSAYALADPGLRRRTSRLAAVAMVLVAAVIAFAVTMAFLAGRTSGAAASPPGAASPSRSSSPAASSAASTASSPSAPAASAPGLSVASASSVVEAVAAFRAVVAAAQGGGLVDAAAAQRMLAAADDVANAQDKGKGKPADKRARELSDLVARSVSDGSVAPAAVGPLTLAAAQISGLAGAER